MKRSLIALAALATVGLVSPNAAEAQDTRMNFFYTSVGLGNGGNLGGLAGADAHCENLAYAVGMGDKTWQAYLSTAAAGGAPAINAKDRIGDGPFFNFGGVIVAENVDQLHAENNLTKETALSESGVMIHGRGDTPNRHDALTGSTIEGTLMAGAGDTTCANWTSNGAGAAQVGHFDRQGGGQNPTSWNSAHATPGCSQAQLRQVGGDGLFFCFARD